ncbi:MAG: hypothetical protein ACYDB7_01050 [Mycobacteriales bacterium]
MPGVAPPNAPTRATKDRASIDLRRGWCRLMGLAANTVMASCAYLARNLRIVDAFGARQAETARRLACGLPPKTRRRRRTTITDLLPPAAAPVATLVPP